MIKYFKAALLAAMTVCPTVSFAESCRDGLIPDVVSNTLDTRSALAFLWTATEEEYNQAKSKGGGSLAIPSIISANFNNDSSRESRRSKLEQLGYRLDESASLNYLASTLPAGTREAYFKCVQTGDSAKPFVLSWSLDGSSADGAVRTIRLDLKRVRIEGDTAKPKELKLSWVADNSELEKNLNKQFKYLKSDPATLTTTFKLPLDQNVSVTVHSVDKSGNPLTSVTLFVPVTPKIDDNKICMNPWRCQVYSIPIYFITHRAGIGNRASTLNYNPDLTSDSDSGNLQPDFLAASSNQEITIKLDDKARAKLPALAESELSFEYRCGFHGPIFFGKPLHPDLFYPSNEGWLLAGQKCGRQEGSSLGPEPVMTHLAFRLTGTKRDDFKAKLSCRLGNEWVDVVPESGCKIPTGITDIRMEIDSVGP